jgi:parallel beta-helix repeat protein
MIVAKGKRFLVVSRERVLCWLPTALLVVTLIAVAVAGLTDQSYKHGEPRFSENSSRSHSTMTYLMHSPISIQGNGGFTNDSGVVWGSGTAADPFIIEGWDINASVSSTAGILMNSTSVDFVIRDCRVHDGRLSQRIGMYARNCTRGVVSNNVFSNDLWGVELRESSEFALRNNTCTLSAGYGIYLLASNDTEISGNFVYQSGHGIELTGSTEIIISGNTCPMNSQAIELIGSDNNSLCNNNLAESASGIRMIVSSNNFIENNNCSHGQIGIYLSPGPDCNNTIASNNVSFNSYYGVFIDSSSSGNLVCSNLIYENQLSGILLSSSGNVVWSNILAGNNGAGGTYDPDHVQARDDGTNNCWNSTDGYGNYWSDWTTPDVAPPYGIVDQPYVIDGNAGAKDFYPQTTPQVPIPEFDMTPLVIIALMGTIVLAEGIGRRKKSDP